MWTSVFRFCAHKFCACLCPRDVTQALSDDLGKSVIVIDTSNEIAGVVPVVRSLVWALPPVRIFSSGSVKEGHL